MATFSTAELRTAVRRAIKKSLKKANKRILACRKIIRAKDLMIIEMKKRLALTLSGAQYVPQVDMNTGMVTELINVKNFSIERDQVCIPDYVVPTPDENAAQSLFTGDAVEDLDRTDSEIEDDTSQVGGSECGSSSDSD